LGGQRHNRAEGGKVPLCVLGRQCDFSPHRPRSRSKFWKALDREVSEAWKHRGQIIPHRKFNRRQLSTTDRIAAIFGPTSGLPTWIQFLRPRATGRIEFSARLLLNSNSGYSKKQVSFGHSGSTSAYPRGNSYAMKSARKNPQADCQLLNASC